MSLIEKIAGALGIKGAEAPPRARSEYMRGGRGVTFLGWKPAIRDAYVDVANSWDASVGRVIDIAHNSGWVAGMIDQAVANTVGSGLRLKVLPENEVFGMTTQAATDWARMVENRFELWSRNPLECDVEGRRSFGQMQAAALRSWFATGEILAELPWRRRRGGRYGTKVRLLPAHRLSRKTDIATNLISGVRMDDDWFPIAYVAIKKDQFQTEVEIEVPARDALGRPRVVHIFDGVPGQVRGISPLTPALQVAKQFDQLSDATLMASIVQAVFAASVTSEQPTDEMLQSLLTPQEQARMMQQGMTPFDAWFEAQTGWYDASVLDVGINGRISHLFPGQKMEFHTAAHPNDNYRDFAMHLLREMARCLGLTYESATGDYEGATYSSVRMAVNEIFAITQYRRRHVVSPFCQAAYEAWLEEEIETGGIPFPGGIGAFLANRAAASRAEWRGAPKPQADDVKAATAHKLWRDMGVITDEMIANDLGVDIEDVYAQRKREKEMRELYDLEEMATLPTQGTPAPAREAGPEDTNDDG